MTEPLLYQGAKAEADGDAGRLRRVADQIEQLAGGWYRFSAHLFRYRAHLIDHGDSMLDYGQDVVGFHKTRYPECDDAPRMRPGIWSEAFRAIGDGIMVEWSQADPPEEPGTKGST